MSKISISKDEEDELLAVKTSQVAQGSLRLSSNSKLRSTINSNRSSLRRDEDVYKHFDYRKLHLVVYVTVSIMVGIIIGFGFGNTTNLLESFNAFYGWKEDSSAASWNDSFISSCFLLGQMIGATVGGKLMFIGRRKTILIAMLIGIVGCCVQIIKLYWCLLLGRTTYGFSSGILSTCIVRLTEEYVPLRTFPTIGPIFHLSMNIGTLIGAFLGLLVPAEDSSVETLNSYNSWRFIMAFPIILYVPTTIMFLVYLTQESPKFYILNNQDEEAYQVIRTIYNIQNEEQADQIFYFIKNNQQKETIKTTIKEAFTLPQYRRASWVNLGSVIFHELLGSNFIFLYSTSIFDAILSDGKPVKPRTATYILQVINVLTSIASVWVVKLFNRRPLMIGGQFGCALSLGLIATCQVVGWDFSTIVMFCIFLALYQNTSGPLTWMHAQSTLTDGALGVCIQSLWATTLVVTLVCNPLMNSKLTQPGTFYLLCTLALGGGAFLWAFIRESTDLTEKEMKKLYDDTDKINVIKH